MCLRMHNKEFLSAIFWLNCAPEPYSFGLGETLALGLFALAPDSTLNVVSCKSQY